MSKSTKFIIDFDSTFTQVEALDILGEISLANDPAREEKLQAIKDITDRGMEGGVTFRESLEKRIELLNADKSQISTLIEVLSRKFPNPLSVTRSFYVKMRQTFTSFPMASRTLSSLLSQIMELARTMYLPMILFTMNQAKSLTSTAAIHFQKITAKQPPSEKLIWKVRSM